MEDTFRDVCGCCQGYGDAVGSLDELDDNAWVLCVV